MRAPWAVGLLALATGCDLRDNPGTAPAAPKGAILILLDTVRADHLSCYGYLRPTTPCIDALAERGTLFEQTVSAAPWTLPSMAALFSANLPIEVLEGTDTPQLLQSLVPELQTAGFATAAVTEGGFLSKTFGFDRGFDLYEEREGEVQLLGDGKLSSGDGGIEATFAAAKKWLEERGDEPFFLVIHTYEAHSPYRRTQYALGMDSGQLPETFSMDLIPELQDEELVLKETEIEYLEALYDGGISVCDRHVGDLVAYLQESGLEDHTLLVVTSDHGEDLGRRYPAHAANHGHTVYDEQLLVPLILFDPTSPYPPQRVPAQVRSIDILPTILDLLRVPSSRQVRGRSLVPFLDGTETQGRLATGGDTTFGPQRSFVRYLGYKLIRVTGPDRGSLPLSPPPAPMELFDLTKDARERRNVIGRRQEVVQQLMRQRKREFAGTPEGEAIALPTEPAMKERLRALGYLR